MKKINNSVLGVIGLIVFVLVLAYVILMPRSAVQAPITATHEQLVPGQTEQIVSLNTVDNSTVGVASPTPEAVMSTTAVGPRENIPKDAPTAYGFWSFAMPVSGVISRSGQPLLSEFQWLKQNGWKGDVDLRHDGEYNDPTADDSKLPGFNELGFNYLHLDILDGHAPTDDQAEQFLAFVTNPVNQPVHVHCRGGYGRAGTMTVLYRYAVQGWSLDKAVAESRLFHGGISDAQLKWLTSYAETHPAGSYK